MTENKKTFEEMCKDVRDAMAALQAAYPQANIIFYDPDYDVEAPAEIPYTAVTVGGWSEVDFFEEADF